MLPFLTPKCPVDACQKAWTEMRLAWLSNQLGKKRLLRAEVLLPTDRCFSQLDGTEPGARNVFVELCRRMQIDPATVEFEVVPEGTMHGVAGVYEWQEGQAKIRVAESQLDDSPALVATLIHELSHQILLGGGYLSPEAEEHEYVTDLLAVFLGMGVFGANAVVRESHETGGTWHSWGIGKQGYLTAREYGYALAVFAWVRRERKSDWRRFLRLDARAFFDRGTKYLRRTKDCLFEELSESKTTDRHHRDVLADLGSRFEGRRVAALWTVRESETRSEEMVDGVITQLHDPNPIIRAEAVATLSVVGSGFPQAASELVQRLDDRDSRVRSQAARAVGTLQVDPQAVMPLVGGLLEDEDHTVLNSALWCVARYGEDAASLTKYVLPVLRGALVRCDFSLAEMATCAISESATDPQREVEQYFAEDEELRRQATDVLESLQDAA